MAKSIFNGNASTAREGAPLAGGTHGPAKPALDLSLGHIGTTGNDVPLNPVRTREDCLSWIDYAEVEQEVFGAFVGAQQHTRKFDFAAFHADASGNDPDFVMEPDTVLFSIGGTAWDRSSFLEYLAAGIVWRLEALAKRKGVDLADFDPAAVVNCPSFREKGFDDPYFAFLGGRVRTFSQAEVDALPTAQRKAIKAAIRKARR